MKFHFNPTEGLIIVRAELIGPAASGTAQMALDTGATRTVVRSALLKAVGYNVEAAPESVEIATASGIERAPICAVDGIFALGLDRTALKVLCLDLPPAAEVDGLLGLDFLRGSVLNIDFRLGRLSLEV